MNIDDIVQVACEIMEIKPEIKDEDINTDLKELLKLSQKFQSDGVKEPDSKMTDTVDNNESNNRNLGSSEVVEIKPEDIKSDEEELELSQKVPSNAINKSHSKITNTIDINESSCRNLGSSEAVEIKPEDIGSSDSEDFIEQLQITDREPLSKPSNDFTVDISENNQTEKEFQYVCNTVNENIQMFNTQGNGKELSKQSTDTEYINSTQIQPLCIDLTEESDHESVPISQISNKFLQAGTSNIKLPNLGAQLWTGQIVQVFNLLTGNSNKTMDTNQITRQILPRPVTEKKPVPEKTPVIKKKPVKIMMVAAGKTNDKTVSADDKKYFFDRQIHEDELIMRPVGYSCAYCSYYSSLLLHIKHHIKFTHRHPNVVKKKGSRQCPFCPKRYISIEQHISSCHSEVKDLEWLECAHCEFKTTKASLTRHIQWKHGELKACEECGKRFREKRNLIIHRRKEHRIELLKCSTCDFTTPFEYTFQRHKCIHPEDGFKCTKCKFHAENFDELTKHKAKEHSNWHQCHICPYRAKYPKLLQLHLIHHQEKKREEDLTYRCKECDYKTYRPYNLQTHMLNHKKPEEIEMFHCYHCNFKTKRKDNLKTHIYKHDIYKSTLTCFLCSFETRSQFELKKHVDVHSENQQKQIEI